MKIKLLSERSEHNRCWFCGTNESVKYMAKIVNTNPLSENRYMQILVCNKCALMHNKDFIDQEA